MTETLIGLVAEKKGQKKVQKCLWATLWLIICAGIGYYVSLAKMDELMTAVFSLISIIFAIGAVYCLYNLIPEKVKEFFQ